MELDPGVGAVSAGRPGIPATTADVLTRPLAGHPDRLALGTVGGTVLLASAGRRRGTVESNGNGDVWQSTAIQRVTRP